MSSTARRSTGASPAQVPAQQAGVPEPDHLLTLDLGTTACKVSLFSLDGPRAGEVAAQTSVEYPTYHPGPGWAEQDAGAWWDAAVAGARRLPQDLRRRVAAVGLSSHRGGIVPVDGAGRPLARCLIWMDRRSMGEVDALVAVLGRERIYETTGLVPDGEFSASKISWLRTHAPDVVRAARWYLQPRDYLYLRLTGEPATDYTLASRTMLFDIHRRAWWPDGCEAAGVAAESFPPLYVSADAPFGVAPEAAAELGIPPHARASLGAGDRPCEVLGAGAGPGRVMMSTGTTTNVSALAPGVPDRLDPRVMCSLHCLDGAVVLEQGLSASGSILRWLRDRLLAGTMDYAALDRLAAAAPLGCDGLVFLPFMMGARATRWDPGARGTWCGLTEAHGLGALARSVMEGVACEVRACLSLLEGMAIRVDEVLAVGGGAASDLWNAIFAAVLGRPVRVPRQTDAASLGAALLAGSAVGRWPHPAEAARQINQVAASFSAEPASAGPAGRLREAYESVYDALRPIFHDGTLG
jgi:xylulokinase